MTSGEGLWICLNWIKICRHLEHDVGLASVTNEGVFTSVFLMSFFTWAVRTFWRSSTDFTNLQHWPSYSHGNANLFSTIFEFVFELFLILFSLEKRLEIGSSATFYNTRPEHVMNILKKGVLSFRDKAGNSYSIAQTRYRTVPYCRGRRFTGLPSKVLSWLSSDSHKSLQSTQWEFCLLSLSSARQLKLTSTSWSSPKAWLLLTFFFFFLMF